MPFDGPVIPFGAMVEYHLISAKDLVETTSIRLPKVLPGIYFLGFCLENTGGIWKGDNYGRRH